VYSVGFEYGLLELELDVVLDELELELVEHDV
jgi:hypothetical protein